MTDFVRVRSVFEQVLEVPLVDRAAVLARECGADAALRSEVEQLLASDASTTPFAAVLDGQAPREAAEGDMLVGATIADFQVRAVLGSGGMGTVYAAEQHEPRRMVALKVLSLGFGSASAVRRFRWEAELLARLRHPAIAQVYATGVHRSGAAELPWFALELVDGARDLLAYAQQARADWRQRIELLLQACDAVHHAHLHGVVHRDLKPQNVLVDRDGRVKVIDFGVARSTDLAEADSAAPHTERGFVLGTLAYMSPEQIAAQPFDLRTDVWSLGVVGFELLAGRRPFEFDRAQPWQAAALVQAQDAPALGKFVRGLPADLEVVLGMALRRDAAQRYASVAAFAEDLRAVLAERPVRARAPSALYHVRMFARRRRGVVLAVVSIALLTITSVVLLVAQNVELARREQHAARLARFARDFLAESDVMRDRGVDYTVREALDEAARAFEQEVFAEPAIEAELRQLVGDAYRGLSVPTAALPQLERAVLLLRDTAGVDGDATLAAELALVLSLHDLERTDEAQARLSTLIERARDRRSPDDPLWLRLQHNQAHLWRGQGKLQDAERLYREVAAARDRVLGKNAPDTIVTLHNLGTALLSLAKPEAARDVLQDCLERSRSAGEARVSTWQIADSLAEAFRELGDAEQAAAMHRESHAGYRELLGPDHALTLGCGYHLLKALHRLGARDELRAVANDLLPRCERTFGPDHHRTMWVLAPVAMLRMQDGDHAGACALMARAFAVQQKSLGPSHPDTITAGQNLSTAQLTAGDAAAALVTTTAVLAAGAQSKDVPPVSAAYSQLLHARALAASERFAEAETAGTAARDALAALLPPEHNLLQQCKALLDDLAVRRAGG